MAGDRVARSVPKFYIRVGGQIRWIYPPKVDLPTTFLESTNLVGEPRLPHPATPTRARGELIGLAFDRNYEALSHKLAFDKDLNRTICVDIRYVLWCIDVLGGAKHIINELSPK